jgi:DNA-binding Xre family transcriptional regulator
MTISKVNRGVFASEEGRRRLETRRSELKLTHEKLAEKAGVSVDSVTRLFGQKRPVQRDTVDRIGWELKLTSIDIIETEKIFEKQQTHFTQLPSTSILGDSELKIPEELGNLVGECQELGTSQTSSEDSVQADLPCEAESVVHQIALCNIEVEENVEVEEVIQELPKGKLVEQTLLSHIKAKNIKVSNVTQKG